MNQNSKPGNPFVPAEIIRKKRDRQKLGSTDIENFFNGLNRAEVTDYQASAMLMAIFLNGMLAEETAVLTKVMKDSGSTLDWSRLGKPVIDKHSTGGIGDKTSLILLPLCALRGLVVPMISGRGLGHTGGTLDKLESIKGVNVFPDTHRAHQIAEKFGGVFLGQTNELAPLDRTLYALRDVTATVESIPLITASILSKKLAAGLHGLVMDVKFGSGAFMNQFDSACALAESLFDIGKRNGLAMECLLTSMEQPLGRNAGNWVEVIECLEVMKGSGPKDTVDLTVALAASMIRISDPRIEEHSLIESLRADLSSGKVWERFCEIIKAQGGDIQDLEKGLLQRSRDLVRLDAKSFESGYVESVDVRELGLVIMELGGGRKRASDKIQHDVGLVNLVHIGDSISSGDPLASVIALDRASAEQAAKRIVQAIKITEHKIEPVKLVRKKIR